VTACRSRFEPDPQTWALGSVSAWVDAILEGRSDRLRIGGDQANLAEDLIKRLHTSLPTTGI
ncbi:MAG TPA: hypothetical protein VMR96_04195, partial [Solirubrobacterales bacterium]|nr:hypothetical protein [Solirubrobacterales bacterium]